MRCNPVLPVRANLYYVINIMGTRKDILVQERTFIFLTVIFTYIEYVILIVKS